MGYYVKYKELQAAQKSIFNQINKWNAELENIKQKIEIVATMEEIKGESANSLKSYMQEIHIPLIQYLKQLLTEYMARMLIYGNEYYKIDTKLDAKMKHEIFVEQICHIISGKGTFQEIESSVATAIGMASGLANVTMPSGERITGSYERLGHKATTLMNDIGNWEYGHLNTDFGTTEDMLSGITQIVNGQIGKPSVTITEYQAGSLSQVPAYQKLQQATKQLVSTKFAQVGNEIPKSVDEISGGTRNNKLNPTDAPDAVGLLDNGFGFTTKQMEKTIPILVKQTPRPNNIGIGTWAKQTTAYADDIAKLGERASKVGTKVFVVGGVVASTAVGVYDNIQKGTDTQRIVTDAAVDAVFSGISIAVGSGFGAAGGAAAGAAIGSVIPVAGTAVGAVVGAVVGVVVSVLASWIFDESTNKWKEDLKEDVDFVADYYLSPYQ